MPPLAVLLLAAEQKKGAPLTEAEAIDLRDRAIVMVNPKAVAKTLAISRGFFDVDPESLWADWHRVRPQLINGFLPKIVLCVLGPAGFADRCKEALAKEDKEAYDTLDVQPADGRMVRSFRSSICHSDPSLTDAVKGEREREKKIGK
jgi:hypothetical protein